MTETSPFKTKTPRWIKLALVGSLAVNLLVLGAVSGAVLSGKSPKDRRVQMAPGFAPYVRALDKDQRRALGVELKSKRGEFRLKRSALQEAYAPVLALLRADTFDAVAFEAAMDAQAERFRSRNTTRDTIGRQGLSKVLDAMSAQERADFAQSLEDVLTRGPKSKK